MLDLWRFLNGDVPGGLALLLVAIISFLAIWIYVYRIGETLQRRTFCRWLWRMPLLFILVYFIAWIQSPPKGAPLRLAVLAENTTPGFEWACDGVADLTARRLRRALKGSVVNPWEGAVDYPAPSSAELERAGYHIFRVQCESHPQSKALQYTLSGANGAGRNFSATERAMVEISAQMRDWIFSELGKKPDSSPPFYRNVPVEILEDYFRGRHLMLSEQIDSALVVLQALGRQDASFWPAINYLGRAYEAKGERELALTAYIQAVQADTGSLEAMLVLGEYYLRIFEWESGEAALKIVLTKDPTAARAAAGLARIHPERLKGLRLNTPQQLLEEAIRLDPISEKARLALADQLSDRGLPELAKKRLNEGLRLNPRSVDLRLKLGAVEIQLGHPEAARTAYEAILENEPLHAAALFNLGVIDYRTKQYDRAIERFKAVQGIQGPVDCYYYLGLIYQNRGDTSRAKFYFQRRWELRASDDDAFAVKARDVAARLEGKRHE